MIGEHGDTMTSDQIEEGADRQIAPQERSEGAAMTDVVLGAKKRQIQGTWGCS